MSMRSKNKSHSGIQTNSRRGTANSKFLRARSRAQRPPGPYRPSRKPRPSRDAGVRNYWILIIILFIAFGLGEIWKESRVSRLCARLDSLRSSQWELDEELLSLQLKLDDLSSYPKIEPLAREKLGMRPAVEPPVVITTVDERFLAFRNKSLQD